MIQSAYDLVIIGGGLGGAALALAMAQHGTKVLVVEREEIFKDRIRGEGMTPWGTAEARALGIGELLRDACALEIRFFDTYAGPMCVRRDLVDTTPQREPCMNFLHPEMQQVLLEAAAKAGAEVRRGVNVTGIITSTGPDTAPRVTVAYGDKVEEISARLVIGADGRNSRARTWGGFSVQKDPHRLFIGGVLLEGAAAPRDAVSLIQNIGRGAIFYPQREGLVRAYVLYHRDVRDERLQGPSDLPQFLDMARQAGAPAAWLADAKPIGPLATFEGADIWVDHPYRDGVVLIGDAAAASDPSWGQGLSLTLRDVRTLRDKLLANTNWDEAAHAYADEHDCYYGALHAVEDWYTKLFMEPGDAADARRQKAMPLIMADPTRVPDVLISGPNQPMGEAERIRFFGE
jgi:2-polyprenyl-6-methoxyphenol hydroxylase-like FAD-dependent oxidoreductase